MTKSILKAMVSLIILGCFALPKAKAAENISSEPDELIDMLVGFKDVVGSIRVEKLHYWNLPPIRHMRTRAVITPEGNWQFHDINGEYCGGRLAKTAAAIDFSKDGKLRKFELEVNFLGVKLGEVMRHFRVQEYKGILDIELGLKVTSSGTEGLSGSLVAKLSKGDLGHLPPALSVISRILLTNTQNQGLEEGTFSLLLSPRALTVTDFELHTKNREFLLSVARNGYITYDGDLDLAITPVFSGRFYDALQEISLTEPGVKVFKQLLGRLARIKVSGNIDEPKITLGAWRD